MDTSKPSHPPAWHYDEFTQVGKDYALPEEAEVYDASHSQFRDIEKENDTILEAIGIGAGDVLIEFGTGTGNFAIQAAGRCARVDAVDVSEAMLDKARAKALKADVTNIDFHHAGFLTFQAQDHSADAVVSSLALHHLPDFWKGIALKRIYRLLRPKGRLYLVDVILEEENTLENIESFIAHQASAGGDFLREDAEGHFREEFSTYDWILDELLGRAGFSIEDKRIQEGILGLYLCSRRG